MKKLMTVFCIALFSLALFAGCSEDKPTSKPEAAKPSAQTAPAAPQSFSGKSGTVLETMDVAGYTYVQIDTGKKKMWAAGPHTKVKVGDDVVLAQAALMRNYHSKTLDRTFKTIYFTSSIGVVGAEQPAGDMPFDPLSTHKGKTVFEATDVDLAGITPAEEGQTIEELFVGKADLSGKKVKVRGKVVKFSPDIMGKNWIHVQDGTGTAGTNDLTVTTSAVVKKGDTVIVSGVMVLDKDFDYGYVYDVLIEDADVTVE